MSLIPTAIIAALLAFAAGWAWYSPSFLGPHWQKAAGKKPEDCKPAKELMAISFGGCLAGAWIYGWIYLNMPQQDFLSALLLAFMIWIAFFLPARASAVMYGGHNRDLIWIDGGYQLACLFIYALAFEMLAAF